MTEGEDVANMFLLGLDELGKGHCGIPCGRGFVGGKERSNIEGLHVWEAGNGRFCLDYVRKTRERLTGESRWMTIQ